MLLQTLRRRYLDDILYKATTGGFLTHQEAVYLLSLEDSDSIQSVLATARKLRALHFDNKVFLYGFIYFSTYCRNHCSFCYYRQSNPISPRYRKNLNEVLDIAGRLADSGVHLLDLTMGEDPLIHNTGHYHILTEITDRVKAETGLPLMISPGVIPEKVLDTLASTGVDWYALYQETHNPALYKKLRVDQSFDKRKESRETAIQTGMLVEDGLLIGAGETTADLADSIMEMKRSGASQVRVMSLVPQKGTPLSRRPTVPRNKEYLSIAVMRLVMPDRLIPASLDVDGINGLKMRLEAGANVVTSIIPPSSSLAGVSQSSLDIEQGLRTVPEVNRIMGDLGLIPASLYDYRNWMADRKEKTSNGGNHYDKDLCSGRSASGS